MLISHLYIILFLACNFGDRSLGQLNTFRMILIERLRKLSTARTMTSLSTKLVNTRSQVFTIDIVLARLRTQPIMWSGFLNPA
jgi:hypothetical protein